MNNLKQINIKNRRCYYFDVITKFEDSNHDNISIAKIHKRLFYFTTFPTKL